MNLFTWLFDTTDTTLKNNKKIALVEEKLAEEKKEMLSKPCPFLGMKNCQENCAHFSEGVVFIGIYELNYVGPKCKLW